MKATGLKRFLELRVTNFPSIWKENMPESETSRERTKLRDEGKERERNRDRKRD